MLIECAVIIGHEQRTVLKGRVGLFFFPLVLVKLQIGVGIYCDLEVGTGASREEIAVYFLEGDSRVDIDAMLLQSCLFQNEDSHKLPEEFAHGFHAAFYCIHVIYGMAHCQEHRLHSSSVRCVIDVRIAVGDVRGADEGLALLKMSESFLEAIQPADLAKAKSVCSSETVSLGQVRKECRGIPTKVCFHGKMILKR